MPLKAKIAAIPTMARLISEQFPVPVVGVVLVLKGESPNPDPLPEQKRPKAKEQEMEQQDVNEKPDFRDCHGLFQAKVGREGMQCNCKGTSDVGCWTSIRQQEADIKVIRIQGKLLVKRSLRPKGQQAERPTFGTPKRHADARHTDVRSRPPFVSTRFRCAQLLTFDVQTSDIRRLPNGIPGRPP